MYNINKTPGDSETMKSGCKYWKGYAGKWEIWQGFILKWEIHGWYCQKYNYNSLLEIQGFQQRNIHWVVTQEI